MLIQAKRPKMKHGISLKKNNDNKNKKQKENNQTKKYTLMEKSTRKKQYYNYLLNDNSDLELTLTNPKICYNYIISKTSIKIVLVIC
jgi:hypothetical protein